MSLNSYHSGLSEPGLAGPWYPPDFYRSVYPISTRGTDYTNLITTWHVHHPSDFQNFLRPCHWLFQRSEQRKKDQIPFLSVNISFLSACSYICSVKNGPNFWRANLFVWIRRGDNDDVTQCKIAIYLSKRLEYIGLLKQVRFFSLNHKMQTLPCNGMGCHHSKNT